MQTAVRKPIKRILVLHDLCSAGKAAMTIILPVLSVMGAEVSPLPTMILSTHTGGYGKPVIRDLSGFSGDCAVHLKSSGFSFDALFLGYLGNQANIEEAKRILGMFPDAFVLFDPIMADHGSFYSNFDEAYGRSLKELLAYSSVATPNYTEACLLSGEPYEPVCTREKLARIREGILESGKAKIVITSIPLSDSYGIGILDGKETILYPYQLKGRAYPGTGDLFAAVLLGSLMKGSSLYESVEKAHEFVSLCISRSDEAGYDTRAGVLLEPNLSKLIVG